MKKDNKQHILCYVDFSELSNNLAEWITYISQKFNNPIDLLFVIDYNTKNIFGKDFTHTSIENKLSSFRNKCNNPSGNNYIREGCNCSMLSSLAEETDVVFCISAVHARNDVQFLSSTAMVKMLRNSRVPCLIIPKRNKFTSPEQINLGINLGKDQKSVAPWLAFIAKHMNIPIQIFFNNKENGIKNNIHFIGNFLKSHNISWQKNEIRTKFSGIDKYCLQEINEPAIHLLYLNKNGGFIPRITGDQDARLIDKTNKQAIFCVNPQKDLFIPCI